MLVDINYGHYSAKTRTPFSSVGWFKEENEYFHPLSLDMAAETYGYHKMNELMPLKDFFGLPNILVESMLDGVSRGLKKREEAEAAKAKSKDTQNPDNFTRHQKAELRKAGINVDKP